MHGVVDMLMNKLRILTRPNQTRSLTPPSPGPSSEALKRTKSPALTLSSSSLSLAIDTGALRSWVPVLWLRLSYKDRAMLGAWEHDGWRKCSGIAAYTNRSPAPTRRFAREHAVFWGQVDELSWPRKRWIRNFLAQSRSHHHLVPLLPFCGHHTITCGLSLSCLSPILCCVVPVRVIDITSTWQYHECSAGRKVK